MASAEDIKRIDLRRLAELEKQRAYAGVDAEPKLILEIADLRAKYPTEAAEASRDSTDQRSMRDLWNEVDFLRAMMTAALREFAQDKEDRVPHQRFMRNWMLALTIGFGILLFLSGLIAFVVTK